MVRLLKRKYPRTAQGDVLTPEMVEALADEAEWGYPRPNFERKYLNLPLAGRGEGMVHIGFRASTDELNRLRELALAEDRRIDSLIHEATMQYLDAKQRRGGK